MSAPVEKVSVAAISEADQAALAVDAARRSRLKWRKRLLPVLAVLCIGILWWQAVTQLGVKPFIAPSPLAVAQVFVTRFHMMLVNLAPTALEAVVGFVLGNTIAVLIATAFVQRKVVEEAFYPVALMVNTIPIVASAPILVLLLGNGIAPKVAISAIICFFPTLVNMTRGFRDVNPQALELMRVLSASDWEVFFKVRVKNALPFLFSALRITASTSVIGAIVGEWIGTNVGIGALIIQATYSFDSALLYASVVMGSALALLFFGIISVAETRIIKWNVAQAR
ncbi:MAG TPA: ABC transporter permease [Magnetospirillaceae bacterium]|jgi:NitT/TauT family transport system permease protein